MATKPGDKIKRERAIALRYADADDVPRIVASGAGELAKRILQLAKENNVPVQEDESLADMLAKLEVGASISPESYKLIAEILSFLYHTDKQWRDSNPHLKQIMGPPKDETEEE